MKAESQRTCPNCGNEFSGAMEFCQSWRAYVACLTALAAPFDSPSSQLHRISPTVERLSDQSHFGSLWEDGEDFCHPHGRVAAVDVPVVLVFVVITIVVEMIAVMIPIMLNSRLTR